MYNREEEEAYLVLVDHHMDKTEEAIVTLTDELARFQGDASILEKKLEILKKMINGLGLMHEHRSEIVVALHANKQ